MMSEIKIEKLYKLEKGIYFLEVKDSDFTSTMWNKLLGTCNSLAKTKGILICLVLTITGNALRFIPDSTLKEKVLKQITCDDCRKNLSKLFEEE